MKYTIIAVLIFCTGTAHAEQGTWTVHTLSTHHQNNDYYNNINPGIAYDMTGNVRIGVVKNSFKRLSLYAMKIHPINSRLRIGWGIVSGYEEQYGSPVVPMAAVEYDVTSNMSLVWFGSGINIEVKF